MKKIALIILPVLFTFLFACKNTTESQPTEITDAEKHAIDSVSKEKQKVIVDSLKRRNPLLIMPPDSNYSGDYVDKYDNGITKYKGFFRFGKRHGQWMAFYPSGLAWSELHFDKGLRHGLNVAYFESGKMRYTGYYKNDVRDSVWLFYDSLGNLAEKVVYKNDQIIKRLPVK